MPLDGTTTRVEDKGVGRKKDIKQVDAICSRYRHLLSNDMEYAFRDYLHECKDSGDMGSDDGDFTNEELIEKLKEFLGVEFWKQQLDDTVEEPE